MDISTTRYIPELLYRSYPHCKATSIAISTIFFACTVPRILTTADRLIYTHAYLGLQEHKYKKRFELITSIAIGAIGLYFFNDALGKPSSATDCAIVSALAFTLPALAVFLYGANELIFILLSPHAAMKTAIASNNQEGALCLSSNPSFRLNESLLEALKEKRWFNVIQNYLRTRPPQQKLKSLEKCTDDKWHAIFLHFALDTDPAWFENEVVFTKILEFLELTETSALRDKIQAEERIAHKAMRFILETAPSDVIQLYLNQQTRVDVTPSQALEIVQTLSASELEGLNFQWLCGLTLLAKREESVGGSFQDALLEKAPKLWYKWQVGDRKYDGTKDLCLYSLYTMFIVDRRIITPASGEWTMALETSIYADGEADSSHEINETHFSAEILQNVVNLPDDASGDTESLSALLALFDEHCKELQDHELTVEGGTCSAADLRTSLEQKILLIQGDTDFIACNGQPNRTKITKLLNCIIDLIRKEEKDEEMKRSTLLDIAKSLRKCGVANIGTNAWHHYKRLKRIETPPASLQDQFALRLFDARSGIIEEMNPASCAHYAMNLRHLLSRRGVEASQIDYADNYQRYPNTPNNRAVIEVRFDQRYSPTFICDCFIDWLFELDQTARLTALSALYTKVYGTDHPQFTLDALSHLRDTGDLDADDIAKIPNVHANQYSTLINGILRGDEPRDEKHRAVLPILTHFGFLQEKPAFTPEALDVE